MKTSSSVMATVCLGLAAVTAPAGAAGDPVPIEEAIATSKTSGRPLIIELGATWCGPCKVFEAKVLPRPEVQAALRGILLVQYDIDVGPGQAADRYRSAGMGASYPVPVFVALDVDGQVKHRLVGIGSGDETARFLAFVAESRLRLMGDDTLRSTLAKKPEDATLHAESGRRAASRGDLTQALSHYDRALAAKTGLSPEPRAEVHAEALRLRRFETTRRQTIRDSAELVRTYPSASNVLSHLALATVGSDLPSSEVSTLYKAVFATDRRATLHRAVYLALAAGARAEAHAGAKKLVSLAPRDVQARDALAETHHALGQTADALRVEDEAIALADEAARPSHQEHRTRIAEGKAQSPLVTAERDKVAHRWAALSGPEEAPRQPAPLTPEQKAQNDFRLALGQAARKATKSCEAAAGDLEQVYFRLVLGPSEGPPTTVEVLEPAARSQLKSCLVKALMTSRFPRAPATFRGRYVGSLYFAKAGRRPGGLSAPVPRM
jgi:tetratricopeptide (TPR) repeat protein